MRHCELAIELIREGVSQQYCFRSMAISQKPTLVWLRATYTPKSVRQDLRVPHAIYLSLTAGPCHVVQPCRGCMRSVMSSRTTRRTYSAPCYQDILHIHRATITAHQPRSYSIGSAQDRRCGSRSFLIAMLSCKRHVDESSSNCCEKLHRAHCRRCLSHLWHM